MGYFTQPILQTIRGFDTQIFSKIWLPQVDQWQSVGDALQLSLKVKKFLNNSVSVEIDVPRADLDLRYRNRENQKKMFLYLVQGEKKIRPDLFNSLKSTNSDLIV